MYNKRSISIIALFVIISIVICVTSISMKFTIDTLEDPLEIETVAESEFSTINYYFIEKNKKVIWMNANSLSMYGQQDISFEFPEGFIYKDSETDSIPVQYKAEKGRFKRAKNSLELYGSVELNHEGSEHKSDYLKYNTKKETTYAKGNVASKSVDPNTKDRLLLEANEMIGNFALKNFRYTSDVRGKLISKRRYEGGMKFSSGVLSYNSRDSLIQMNKDVNIVRNNYDLEAQRAEIFLKNRNKKLKYYVLYDDIKLEEKLRTPEGPMERKAFSEKLESVSSTGITVLTGAPRVEQRGDMIRGTKITLRENVELIEVDDSQASYKIKKKKSKKKKNK